MGNINLYIYVYVYIYGLLQLYPDLKFSVIWALTAFEHLSDVVELDGVLSRTLPLLRKATFSDMSNLKQLCATTQTASSVRFENVC